MMKTINYEMSLDEVKEWIDNRLANNKIEQEYMLLDFQRECAKKKRDKIKEIPIDIDYYLNDQYKELLEEEKNLRYAKNVVWHIGE